MRVTCSFLASCALLIATQAQAQPGTLPVLPPAEPPRVGPSFSPSGLPILDVPGCGEAPPIVEWRVIEPLRRWLVARRAGVSVPGWPHLRMRMRIETADGSRELVVLEETFFSAPEDPRAYASLLPDCAEMSERPPWWTGMRNARVAFRCPADGSIVILVPHGDGLVLRATMPTNDDGEPDCAALHLMASLTPLRSPARACRGRCRFYDGWIESDSDALVFEVRQPVAGTSVRELFEVVPVGADRFEIILASGWDAGAPLSDSSAPSWMTFLGARRRGEEVRDEGRILRGATVVLRPGPLSNEAPFELAISVGGSPGAFERGLRFAEALTTGPRASGYTIAERPVKSARSRAAPKHGESIGWAARGALLLVVLVGSALVWALSRVTRRRR